MSTYFDIICQDLNNTIGKYLEPNIQISLTFNVKTCRENMMGFICLIEMKLCVYLKMGQSSIISSQNNFYNIFGHGLVLDGMLHHKPNIIYYEKDVKTYLKSQLQKFFCKDDKKTIIFNLYTKYNNENHITHIKVKLSDSQYDCLWAIFNEETWNLFPKIKKKLAKNGYKCYRSLLYAEMDPPIDKSFKIDVILSGTETIKSAYL